MIRSNKVTNSFSSFAVTNSIRLRIGFKRRAWKKNWIPGNNPQTYIQAYYFLPGICNTITSHGTAKWNEQLMLYVAKHHRVRYKTDPYECVYIYLITIIQKNIMKYRTTEHVIGFAIIIIGLRLFVYSANSKLTKLKCMKYTKFIHRICWWSNSSWLCLKCQTYIVEYVSSGYHNVI